MLCPFDGYARKALEEQVFNEIIDILRSIDLQSGIADTTAALPINKA